MNEWLSLNRWFRESGFPPSRRGIRCGRPDVFGKNQICKTMRTAIGALAILLAFHRDRLEYKRMNQVGIANPNTRA
jgi:hypothetical protein